MARRLIPLLATLAAILLVPSVVHAAQRYAAPSPSGAANCSSPSDACDIATAFSGAGAGDELILASGDYGSAGSPLTTSLASAQPNLNVHGVDGQPRPRIFVLTGINTSGVDLSGAGTKARHFEINQLAGGGNQVALTLGSDAQGTHIVARSTNIQGKGCTVLANSVLTNSVCEATGDNGAGIFTYRNSAGPQPNQAKVRNVTALAPHATGAGILVTSSVGGPQDISVINSIADGGSVDVRATRGDSSTQANVTMRYSNYFFTSNNDQTNFPMNGQVIDGGNNQRGDKLPVFVAPGDYHQAATSPTIDSGDNASTSGTADLDGDPRIVGGRTDIGADEFVPTPGGGPGSGGPGGGGDGSLDAIAPIASNLRVKPRNLRAASSGGSIAAAIGTQVTYGLSEAGVVTFTVERATTGRRKGKKCVKQRRSNRKRKRCTRYVKVKGSFVHPAVAGQNGFRFTGRLNGKKLKLGSHRLVGTPKDLVGNTGKPVTAKFKIVRK